jgi:nucleotide-binding universal stress UspA family protein
MTRPLTILVASDGSSSARAAVSLAGHLPWPDDTRAIGVVAGATPPAIGLGLLYRDALMQGYRSEAQRLEVFLRDRFSESRVALAGKPPVDAILAEQRRRRAHVIVVGRRGLGVLGRLALGSVSRRVVQEAPCAVLVAKRASHAVRRFVIAVDGSAASLRGVRFIERLKASTGGRVLLVEVVPPIPLPLMGRAPASVRSDVRRHVALEQAKRGAAARRHLDNASKRLRTAGWNVTTDVRRGTPVVEILKAASTWRADVLVCGARNTQGVNRLLLGSVADGLVSRSPVSVLIAR